MRYLGGLCGGGVRIACATYEFACFIKPLGVHGCGEIRSDAAALQDVFGRDDILLFADDGRFFDIAVSAKELPAMSDIAHADVTGSLDR